MFILDANNLFNINTFFLTIAACCATIFTTVYLANRKMRKEIAEKNEEQLKKKADLTYVKEKNLEHEKDIIEIKASIKTMGDGNSRQHKDMFSKIEEVGKGVARIEGYLSAKKEK